MSSVADWTPYLQGKRWTQFATFTTSLPISLKSARRLMDKVAVRVLRDGECMFWAAERFDLGREGFHVHALIDTRHSPKQVEDWYSKRYGRADVRRYDRKRGAAGYVAKYMTKAVFDYDMLLGRGDLELFGLKRETEKTSTRGIHSHSRKLGQEKGENCS